MNLGDDGALAEEGEKQESDPRGGRVERGPVMIPLTTTLAKFPSGFGVSPSFPKKHHHNLWRSRHVSVLCRPPCQNPPVFERCSCIEIAQNNPRITQERRWMVRSYHSPKNLGM
ncbi:hypothetical protein Nepgr_003561 [Nepenthes gracilis]|uniref:Uncharacterized protein n=1 Tax=Nepenthes gracilis TaxID=150966 RepID=A0AAD3XDV0_NEPGR|nr:hypothetical protein Nepgr_003561 [Nepenthes gracilis]